MYRNFAYLRWRYRTKNGLKDLLKLNKAKSLWEIHGFTDPSYFQVSYRKDFFISVPHLFSQPKVLVELPRKINLYDTKTFSASDSLYPVSVTFRKVFSVDPNKIRHGCCVSYSLAKATYLRQTIGADPFCGGGIKHYWPPLRQRKKEHSELLEKVDFSSKISALVLVLDKDASNCVFFRNRDNELPRGQLTVLLGRADDVSKYCTQSEACKEHGVKSAEIVFFR